jgi:hypothetical protein
VPEGSPLDRLTPQQWSAAWESSPVLVVVTSGADHRVVFQNAAARELFGAVELGGPLRTTFPLFGEAAFAAMDRVLHEGTTAQRPEGPVEVVGSHGQRVHLLPLFAPLGAPRDHLPAAGVVMTGIDVSSQVAAERMAARAGMLAEVSDRMSGATDPDGALRRLTEALVPTLADVAAVYVRPLGPARPVVAGTGRRPQPSPQGLPARALAVAADLRDRVGMPPGQGSPSDRPRWEGALEAGRPVLLDLPPPGTDAVLTDSPTDRWLRAAGSHTVAVLPLAVAGELAGAVVLLGAGDRAPYTLADLPFLEDVAARAGVAVTHLRGFDQQRRIAQNLQRALLPDVPTTLPGLRVAARYVAGADGLEVGGDWWDVHDLGGGRTGVGIGDVAGRGLAAAVVMGQARSVMRTGAIAGLSPGELLTMLDRHVADLVQRAGDSGADQPQFATASYAVIDRVAGTLTVANAGHPPMLLRYDGGPTIAAHAPPGPPLGIGTGGYEEVEVAFGPGCLLAAFTDGLVESSELDVGAGIERLRGHVDAVADEDLEDAADRLLEAMTGRRGQDDVALVLLHQDT